MSQPGPALFLCLLLVLEGTSGNFFKPLTCHQDSSVKKKCGGEAESFYPHQCQQKKCCYHNHTCYYHVIDGARQRRNAGILGGTSVIVVIFSMCLYFSWKFKEFQKKEKEFDRPRSEGEIAGYLVRLLDEGSEPDEDRGHESLDVRDPWMQGNFSQQPDWILESREQQGGMDQRQWSPEMSPEPMKQVETMMPVAMPEPAPAPVPEPPPALPPVPAPAPAPSPEPPPAPAPVPPPPPEPPPPPPPEPPPPPPPEPPPAPPPEPPPAPPPEPPPAPPPGPPPAPPPGPPPAPPPGPPPA
ncbi:protein TsetseEP-like isoform X2 [Rhineura floridana]|uniref:protein TsetseEP-like isoform X2 n=1 Tax=Rhineura floridana TaxID=261503 RepID=UPI002AC82249|nr:protein TsetseEP-like isoform X2 [Rhineura floridana]